MSVVEKSDDCVSLTYPSSSVPFVLKFTLTDTPINHAKAYGRLAIAIPTASLSTIEQHYPSDAQEKTQPIGSISVPRVKLETPGKATVEVIILNDGDAYEVCVVGEEAFFELAKREIDVAVDWDARIELGTNEVSDF